MAKKGLYYELFNTQAQYYQNNKDGDDLWKDYFLN